MLPGDNIGLVTTRLTKGERFQHVLATRQMNEVICLSSKTSNNGFIFPLYLYPDEKMMAGHERRPNLSPAFVKTLAGALGLKQAGPGQLYMFTPPGAKALLPQANDPRIEIRLGRALAPESMESLAIRPKGGRTPVAEELSRLQECVVKR
jgi:hypothetical protein